MAALRDGKVLELNNLVPWEGVKLDIKGVRVAGLQVKIRCASFKYLHCRT